uniref:(California timema) hypothetical protein n=1 Tax=Timema californicum TaxID=61474 RepID=A0A7R9JE65_TIMCA|nr:unnamed protein product [Timema californicum]
MKVLLIVAMFAVSLATPIPEPGGGWHGKHEHYIIHVPYHVHTVHHHHVHEHPVYVKKGWSSHGWY